MEIEWSRIERSSTTFRGIIPSREARCTGKITLDVVFGSPDNYRSKEVMFQVAPFSSGYHALLGREAFTIFQAIPHYGYMKLKMPGPNGIITLASDSDAPTSRRKQNRSTSPGSIIRSPSGRRINNATGHHGQGRCDTRQATQVHLI